MNAANILENAAFPPFPKPMALGERCKKKGKEKEKVRKWKDKGKI
jgi:hypothetical protein